MKKQQGVLSQFNFTIANRLIQVDDAKEDYFSQLPDDVLSSILASLTLTDAVKTSILSRRWKHLFAFIGPTLKFTCLDMFGIHSCNHSCFPYYQHKFLKGVNQLLQLYSGRKVAHVEMSFCFGREFSSEFDQWMHCISRIGIVQGIHINEFTLLLSMNLRLRFKREINPFLFDVVDVPTE
ncbi:hypothetical protein RND71_038188 [Anisodus tanguticus]|uniref:F-box domain-containing protein n=1 Tax=Anisodus tanguticus TaxID=243964 RepID=A0AAE1R1S4_9SOLA|nr:hypothetical protein RND71_038188 [Anisodus tanguticus]